MKSNLTSASASAALPLIPATFSFAPCPEGPDLLHAPAPAGTVRILLGIDVPAAALPEIEATWAAIPNAGCAAPEQVRARVDAALDRLQRVAVAISGVAVAERLTNPLTLWRRDKA